MHFYSGLLMYFCSGVDTVYGENETAGAKQSARTAYVPTRVIRSLTSQSRRATSASYDSLLEVFSLQLA